MKVKFVFQAWRELASIESRENLGVLPALMYIMTDKEGRKSLYKEMDFMTKSEKERKAIISLRRKWESRGGGWNIK